ncbi:hypothetical protein ACFXKX_28775 [Streptomyces scopuliridis]|uniref:hypothetical protein n=1 Tax=Streptomyces scopuliridis TaxID=452529 RepID=UPI0036AD64D7
MTREDLAAMLGGDTDAHALARTALAEGGHFDVWDGLVPATQLASVYGRRLRHTRRRAQETLALSSAVDILERAGDALIRIGQIGTTDRTWNFMLFFDATASTLLACTGVRLTEPGKPQSSPG